MNAADGVPTVTSVHYGRGHRRNLDIKFMRVLDANAYDIISIYRRLQQLKIQRRD